MLHMQKPLQMPESFSLDGMLASRTETLVLAGLAKVAVVMAIVLTATPLLMRVDGYDTQSPHACQLISSAEAATAGEQHRNSAAGRPSHHKQLAGAAEGAVVPASSLTQRPC